MNEIPSQTFELLMARFDRLESLLQKHMEEDVAYYKKTDKHEGYFRILWVALASVGGILVAVWGSISPYVVGKFFKG